MTISMRTFLVTIVGLSLTVCGWGSPIVQNASFELNVLGSPFVGSAATVANWVHTGNGDGPHWAVGYSDVGGSITVAGQGNEFVTMGGGNAIGTASWSQAVSGFTIGQLYQLTFMLAGETTADSNQVVSAEAIGATTQMQNFTAPASSGGNYWHTWQAFSFNFTADSATETLLFTSTTLHDVGLDNVGVTQLTAVPEPATWALIGLGIGWLAIMRRNRQIAGR